MYHTRYGWKMPSSYFYPAEKVINGSLVGCFNSVSRKVSTPERERMPPGIIFTCTHPRTCVYNSLPNFEWVFRMARFEGSLVFWNSERGFGFIKPKSGGQDIFVHVRDLQFKGKTPLIGNTIFYDITQRKDGKYRAVNAYVIGEKHNKSIIYAILIGLNIAFVTIPFVLSLYIINITYYPLVLYSLLSFVCFFVYVYDKQMAISGGWRIQESSLHWLEIFGGWPGALIAQMIIGHKNSKIAFQFIFSVIVLLHFIAWAAYLLFYQSKFQ